MKLLVISHEYIIPWEHNRFSKCLTDKAIDEKYLKRPLDEIVANAAAAFNELQALGDSKDYKKYIGRYHGEGWKHVPPVPVVEVPDDLLHMGFFIIYNGHHRLEAAKRADMPLPVILLENDADMKPLLESGELYLPSDFSLNKDYVWRRAR